MIKKLVAVTAILLFFHSFLFAQNYNLPERPSPEVLVNNLSKQFPSFLGSSEIGALEQKLVAFADSTSNQIAVVIVDDFGGTDANDFGTRLFNKWEIGQKKNNNGVLLLIKPTETDGGRKAYIIVGRGLEPVIPDLIAKQIIEEELIPDFKAGDYGQGINNAVDKIMGFAVGEFKSDEYANHSSGWGGGTLKFIVIAIIIIILVVRSMRGGGGMTMGRGGIFFGGGFGGFGGGGFGGGGGGGGFGGFGGGSSGGGGAGGSW